MNTTRPAAWSASILVLLILKSLAPQLGAAMPAEDMAAAANHFLQALTPEQKAKAHFTWEDEERFNWHFIPRDRQGLSFKDMEPAQSQLGFALLASAMSSAGAIKATTIMSLEKILQDLEGPDRRFSRDPQLYFISVFGKPSAEGTWGWRVEGHHLSLNFTIVKGAHIAATPSFMGTNPAKVLSGPRQGLRVLAEEEDLGRQLVQSLDADQKKLAIIAEKAPSDIITGASRDVSPLEWEGLGQAKMNAEQKVLLQRLIRTYLDRHRPEIAQKDWQAIEKAGMENILFAWAGGVEVGDGHYYRVQGPTFLLEYDSTQNNANHVHAVWRDFANDFGEDLLRKHYEQDH